jgi:uncharacterized lipoprotein YbaY
MDASAWVLRSMTALAAVALAACAAPSPQITGRLTHAEEVALPPQSQLVVELRDEASDRVIAEQRQRLQGREPSIPFVLVVDPARVSAGGRYSVRALVQAPDPQLLWLTEPKPVETSALRQDIGELQLVRSERPPAFASTLDCGGRRLLFGVVKQQPRLVEGRRGWTMRQEPAASGERFVAVDDPGTWLWFKGQQAQISVGGQLLPDCAVRHGAS